MKFFNYWRVVIVALFAVFVLNACDKDDGENDNGGKGGNSIVGKTFLRDARYVEDDYGDEENMHANNGTFIAEFYKFYANGKYDYCELYCDEGSAGCSIEHGTYTIDGDNIKMSDEENGTNINTILKVGNAYALRVSGYFEPFDETKLFTGSIESVVSEFKSRHSGHFEE